jgi:hypothetical protein
MVLPHVLDDPRAAAAKEFRAASLRDAAYIMKQSNIVAHLHNVEVVLRKALCIVANARLYELQQAWKTATPHATLAQVLSEIAFNQTYQDGVPVSTMVNAALLRTVIPTIDMLGMQFDKLQEQGVEIDQIYQAFCRVGEQSEAGLAAVQRGTNSDTVEETGECGSGDSGETGGEGD